MPKSRKRQTAIADLERQIEDLKVEVARLRGRIIRLEGRDTPIVPYTPIPRTPPWPRPEPTNPYEWPRPLGPIPKLPERTPEPRDDPYYPNAPFPYRVTC